MIETMPFKYLNIICIVNAVMEHFNRQVVILKKPLISNFHLTRVYITIARYALLFFVRIRSCICSNSTKYVYSLRMCNNLTMMYHHASCDGVNDAHNVIMVYGEMLAFDL